MTSRRCSVGVALLLLLTGCTLRPRYRRPAVTVPDALSCIHNRGGLRSGLSERRKIVGGFRRSPNSRNVSARRAQGGTTSLMDVRESEQLVYTASAAIPDLETRIEEKETLDKRPAGTQSCPHPYDLNVWNFEGQLTNQYFPQEGYASTRSAGVSSSHLPAVNQASFRAHPDCDTVISVSSPLSPHTSNLLQCAASLCRKVDIMVRANGVTYLAVRPASCFKYEFYLCLSFTLLT